jgi:tryptophan 2,3-dioxygenase
MSEELTYSGYLGLDRLLDLQALRSDPAEHDEMLFIVIHQTYELWFKQVLHEVDYLKVCLTDDRLWEAVHVLKRVRMIVKTLVGQVDVLETMTPMSFSSFRDRLDRASGLQSVQFRELEFALGYKRREVLDPIRPGTPHREELQRRLTERSVIDHFYDFLEKRGVAIPEELRAKDPAAANVPSEAVQDGLVRLYKEQPETTILLELMTDVDEGLQEWRYRHVKAVERTIGHKLGTGGSAGVEWLKRSLFQPLFPDLWAIRSRLGDSHL